MSPDLGIGPEGICIVALGHLCLPKVLNIPAFSKTHGDKLPRDLVKQAVIQQVSGRA